MRQSGMPLARGDHYGVTWFNEQEEVELICAQRQAEPSCTIWQTWHAGRQAAILSEGERMK